MHLREQFRPHQDVDVAVLRRDQQKLQAYLAGWSLYQSREGALAPWLTGEELALPIHVVHAKKGRLHLELLGTFGEDGGKSELAVFDKHFSAYTLPFKSRDPIVGLAWHCDDLYGVEIFPYDNQWSTESANLVRFDRKTGKRTKVLTGFATFPNGLVEGPEGALYTSNQGISFALGDGEILRIVP